MTVSFELPLKAFSINQMSCRDQRFKTAEYKDYATKALYLLNEIKELYDMALLHQERGGAFRVEITATYPTHVYYNKDKTISSKTIDCSNFEKPLIDLIFGGTMAINDKHIECLISRKEPGAQYGLKVKIVLEQ